jgi:hypothetical protein
MKINTKYFLVLFTLLLFSICWLMVVFKIGVLGALLRPRPGVFPFTFAWWDSQAWQSHLCLGIFDQSNIGRGEAYTTYTQLFLGSNYCFMFFFHALFHIKYEVGQNMIVLFYILCFLLLIYRLRQKEIVALVSAQVLKLFWLFMMVGIIITNSLPYVSFLRYNADNFHFIVSLLFCYLSVIEQSEKDSYKDKRFMLVGVTMSMFSVIYFVPWILCYFFSGKKFMLRKKMVINCSLVGLAFIVQYFLPIITLRYLGFKNISSDFFYRTGLDGSSTYLKSSFSPYFTAISEQHIGNQILLFCAVVIMIIVAKQQRIKILNQVVFNFIPFLFVYIFLPQFCTIHAYLVEFLFVTPLLFLLVYWLLSIKVDELFSPKKFVYITLFSLLIIMGQLIEIAKSFM